MFNLIPKEEAFFDLFEKATDNAHACCLALQEFLERYDDLEIRYHYTKDRGLLRSAVAAHPRST